MGRPMPSPATNRPTNYWPQAPPLTSTTWSNTPPSAPPAWSATTSMTSPVAPARTNSSQCTRHPPARHDYTPSPSSLKPSNAQASEMAALRGTGIWSGALRFSDPAAIADAAAELEELGYSCLWIPDMGGDVFGAVRHLLESTRKLTVATGVLNLWVHSPDETAAAYHRIQADHGDRFLVGIGVGHAARIDSLMPGRYRGPVGAMNNFLDGLDHAAVPLPRRG